MTRWVGDSHAPSRPYVALMALVSNIWCSSVLLSVGLQVAKDFYDESPEIFAMDDKEVSMHGQLQGHGRMGIKQGCGCMDNNMGVDVWTTESVWMYGQQRAFSCHGLHVAAGAHQAVPCTSNVRYKRTAASWTSVWVASMSLGQSRTLIRCEETRAQGKSIFRC